MRLTSLMTPLALALALAAPTACDPGNDDNDDSMAAPMADGEDPNEDLTAPEAALCDRIDECGYLGAGYSVGDCTDIVGACTDDLLTSAKADWDNAANNCLDLNNCQNFGSCFASIDVCIADVDIEFEGQGGDGSGDGPNPPSDDTGGPACQDYQVCADPDTIEACIDGEVYVFDCDLVCVNEGFEGSVGCGYDEEAEVDVCFCV